MKFKDYLNDSLTEAVNAKKVYDYYMSTMKNFQKFGEYYSNARHEDKINRRILTDYAGNQKVLKDIYKQINTMANTVDDEMTKLEKIIG